MQIHRRHRGNEAPVSGAMDSSYQQQTRVWSNVSVTRMVVVVVILFGAGWVLLSFFDHRRLFPCNSICYLFVNI